MYGDIKKLPAACNRDKAIREIALELFRSLPVDSKLRNVEMRFNYPESVVRVNLPFDDEFF